MPPASFNFIPFARIRKGNLFKPKAEDFITTKKEGLIRNCCSRNPIFVAFVLGNYTVCGTLSWLKSYGSQVWSRPKVLSKMAFPLENFQVYERRRVTRALCCCTRDAFTRAARSFFEKCTHIWDNISRLTNCNHRCSKSRPKTQ